MSQFPGLPPDRPRFPCAHQLVRSDSIDLRDFIPKRRACMLEGAAPPGAPRLKAPLGVESGFVDEKAPWAGQEASHVSWASDCDEEADAEKFDEEQDMAEPGPLLGPLYDEKSGGFGESGLRVKLRRHEDPTGQCDKHDLLALRTDDSREGLPVLCAASGVINGLKDNLLEIPSRSGMFFYEVPAGRLDCRLPFNAAPAQDGQRTLRKEPGLDEELDKLRKELKKILKHSVPLSFRRALTEAERRIEGAGVPMAMLPMPDPLPGKSPKHESR